MRYGKCALKDLKAKGRLEDDCNIAWAKRVNEDQAEMQHWTLHDLRRTFSTIHARIGTAIDIQEALLNHKSGSRSSIQRVYDRYDRLEPMRIAMRNYEEHLTKLFSGSADAALKTPGTSTT